MPIPYTQIQEQLRSYTRLDASVFIQDNPQLSRSDQSTSHIFSMNQWKKEQLLKEIQKKILDKIKEHALQAPVLSGDEQ